MLVNGSKRLYTVVKSFSVSSESGYWTSASREGVSNVFNWGDSGLTIDGSESEYFFKGQPDFAGGTENCLHLRFSDKEGVYLLNDNECYNEMKVLCETL